MSWSNYPPREQVVHLLVIKTNKYAGNFEREMCAYMTGQIGECGVGFDIACDAFGIEHPEQSPWFEKTDLIPDEHGCCRPASIVPDDEGMYNAVGIAFYEKPTDEELQELKQRAIDFCEYYRHHERSFDAYKDDPIVVKEVVWSTYTVTIHVDEERI